MGNETQTQGTKGSKKGEAPPPPVKPPEPQPPQQALTLPPETTAMEVFDYGEDAGQGFENQTMADRKLPIIELLQSNSPEVVESKGKVWAGLFRNTVTGEIYEEVYFVGAITDNCWTQWVSRDDGGGFRGRHPINSKIVRDAIARNDGRAIGKLPVPQPPDKAGKPQPTHELVENFEVYAILFDKAGEILGFCMIPFASTKIKVYKAWNSSIAGFAPTFYLVKDAAGQPQGQFAFADPAQKKAASIGGTVQPIKMMPGKLPIFAHRVKMTSETETKGPLTYMIPVLSPAEGGDDLKLSLLPRTDARYMAAKKLHDDVLAGLAKAAYETSTQDPGADAEAPAPF